MAIQDETITDVVLSIFKMIDNVAPVEKRNILAMTFDVDSLSASTFRLMKGYWGHIPEYLIPE